MKARRAPGLLASLAAVALFAMTPLSLVTPSDERSEAAHAVRDDAAGLTTPPTVAVPPPLAVLETGLAVRSSGLHKWGERGFEYWAARLHSAGLVPPVARILSGDWTREASPFVAQPVAGAFVLYLMELWPDLGAGSTELRERYLAWAPDPGDVERMEEGWSAFLDALLRRHEVAVARDLAEAEARRAAGLPPMLGVNFANEGYGRYEGYLSERSDRSLARLAELGASGVAILPYAFVRSGDTPMPLLAPTRPGSETDEAVIRAISTARELGLTVLLKPHLWLRGGWPGEIEMRSAEDWDRFFAYYERWILHYALLAEIQRVPVLSVGVELSRATVDMEDRWEALVGRVRSIYSGALVYAANWGEEFESLRFWDVFDYLGVDAYYPLSEDAEASDEALRRGADAMLDRIERVQRAYGKPVLFTEIGFASARAPWVRPWEGHLADQPSPRDQLRSYRAVVEAMREREWIGGVFWWEWPSDLRRADRDVRGFMPAGKPTEHLLAEWFQDSRVE